MDLHVFGFNGNTHLPNTATKADILLPTAVLHAREINVKWASWCDTVVWQKRADNGEVVMSYHGHGMLRRVRAAYDLETFDSTLALFSGRDCTFFGGQLDTGARGAMTGDGSVYLFHGDGPIRPLLRRYTFDESLWKISGIQVTSSGSVIASATRPQPALTRQSYMVEVPSVQELNETSLNSIKYPVMCNFAPPSGRWCVNAMTVTALDDEGRVYTYARDKRYPKCLGRPDDIPAGNSADSAARRIEYLSETKIEQIASGAYMTAAVSDDGELFLWGQAPPGSSGELSILKTNRDQEDDEQDEYLKAVSFESDGREAKVVKISIGWGHILVATELVVGSGKVKRAVFAAGEGHRGQLGIGKKVPFQEDFVEVDLLRDKKIHQLYCAGYSSLVITRE